MVCGFSLTLMAYEANSTIVYYFNLRTRSLNNLLFYTIMIPAPIGLAYILDNKNIKSRRSRGQLGALAVGLITTGATCGLLAWTISNGIDRNNPPPAVDWSDSRFAAGFVLYLLFGVVFACFQIIVQWTLASLTNDPSTCARYAGAFKGTVSLGMCVSFTIDSQGMSFRDQIILQLVLYFAGLVSLVYVLTVYVKQSNYFLEDSVIPPATFTDNMETDKAGADNALTVEQVEKKGQN